MKQIAAIALACAALGCSRAEPAGPGGGAALMRNLLRAREIELTAPEGPIADAVQRAAELVARERNVACVVRPSAPDARNPRIVVAAASQDADPLAEILLAKIGVTLSGDASRPSFTILKEEFGGPADALVAVLEDPERPGLPVTLLYGNDGAAVARYAEGIDAGWKPWLRIYREGMLAIEGPLFTGGWPREGALLDREPQRARTYASYRAYGVPDASIRIKSAPAIDDARREAYLAAVDRARKRTEHWAGPGSFELELVLHARPERLLECSSAPGLAAANPVQRRVDVLLLDGVPDDAGTSAARLIAEQVLGPSSRPWIADGAAVHAAGAWWGRDLEEWIAWLRLGGLVPGIEAIVDPDATRSNSRHLVVPLRAALFRYLLESRGEAFARSLWTGSASLPPEGTENAFVQWLDEIATRHRAALDAVRAERRKASRLEPFLTAVGIEESGAGAERGFGSEVFETTLGEARAIGARAVVLSCFVAAERDPSPIPDLEARFRDFEPFEYDLRVFSGLARARAAGMRAWLQPRLLNAPGGTLAGTDPQGSEKGWQRFFDSYARFSIHVGLLAELAGAEGLVLGGGMTETTNRIVGEQAGTEEHARWRSEGWERVLTAARGAFAACLTWAADSVADAQVLSFWSGLDAVGCDLEPALDMDLASFDPRPGAVLEERLEDAITSFEGIAQSVGKPLILTRAGFRPGAQRPGRPALARAGADPGMQVLGFEILGRELRESKARGTLRGLVLWRWSSDPEDAGATEKDAVLRRGPAREAAARALAGL